MQILDSRRLGGAWMLDRLWQRLGIGAAIRRAAEGRRLDADTVERVIFTLVAQRALEPGSKLAATGWVAERVAIEGLSGLGDDQAYRGMDFLLIRVVENTTGDTWPNIAHELDRIHLITLTTSHGQVAQRSAITPRQKEILTALDLPEPPRYLDFTPVDA